MLRLILVFLVVPAALFAQQWRTFTTADGLPSNEITALALRDSILWVGTPAGLARFNGSEWTIQTADSGLPGNYVKSLYASQSALWAGTASGLGRFENGQWTSFTTLTSPLLSNDIRAIAEWNGRLWFATSGGLAGFDGSAWTIYTSKNSQLPSDNLLALAVEGGRLWIGTEGSGLAGFNGSAWTVFTSSNSSLPSNTIVSLTGSEGRLFVGLWDDNGLAVYHQDGSWTVQPNVTDGSVRSLASAPCGHVWMGTRFGGLTDDRTQFGALYRTTSSQIPGNYVLALAPDEEDIWVGTQTGLAFLDRQKAMYVRVPDGVCQGETFTTQFDIDGLASCSGTFRVLLSDAGGSFNLPLQLDVVSASYPFSAQFVLPASVPAGSGYRIRIAESSGIVEGTSGTFSVRATPAPRISEQSTVYLCGEESITFDAGSFASYQWSGGETSRFLTVSQPGVYSVNVTSSEGCSATSPAVSVQRRERPVPVLEFTGATTFCPGDSVVLGVGLYAQYRWSNGATSATLAVKEAGTYSVVVTDDFGCTGATQTVEFDLYPRPTKPVITNISGTLYSSPALAYQWYRNGTELTGAIERTYKPTISGSYTVASFNEHSCRTLSEPYTLNISSAGEEEDAGYALSVVVGDGELLISGRTDTPRDIRVSIVDLPGRRVEELRFTAVPGEFRTAFPLSRLATGAYIALCESGGYVNTFPFMYR